MFPRQLSEQLFSFREGQQSSALSIWMILSEDGSLSDCGAKCSTVRATRLTYQALNEKLSNDAACDGDLQHLSKVLLLRDT